MGSKCCMGISFDFQQGISVFANFSCGIVVLGTANVPFWRLIRIFNLFTEKYIFPGPRTVEENFFEGPF